MIRDKRIVVAVLDWGLGHATRSVPIIRQLLDVGNTITIASSGLALHVLREEFPLCQTLELPSYNISYTSSSMVLNMLLQTPKILKTIKAEQSVLRRYTDYNPHDVIISDNRYGCYIDGLENIFVSHQLNLEAPFAASMINKVQARWIRPFETVWVPDDEKRTLSGDLSDPKYYLNKTIKYIGPQSRLVKTNSSKTYDITVLLSGPEPQRTYLEDELLKQLNSLDLKCSLIRGSNFTTPHNLCNSKNIQIIDIANAQQISEIVSESKLIIGRSGYSTIMDLAHIGGKALFIPTPGQTEQEYLAHNLKIKGIADFQVQGKVDLNSAWNRKNLFTGW